MAARIQHDRNLPHASDSPFSEPPFLWPPLLYRRTVRPPSVPWVCFSTSFCESVHPSGVLSLTFMPADRSAQKLRRWIDLIVALLRRSGPASFNDFKGDVPSYATSDAAPESVLRTFERDKDELIRFGIPIEVSNDLKGVGLYRIKPGNFYLPMLQLGEALGLETPPRQRARGDRAISTLAFTPDELSLVVRAGRRVQQLGDPYLAAAAAGARRKLAFELALPDDDVMYLDHMEPNEDYPLSLHLPLPTFSALKPIGE